MERILCDPSYSVYRARIVAGCAASNRRHQDAFEKMTEEESSLFQDYLMYNLFSLFTHWIDQGRSASLEHLIHFAFKMSDRGVSWLRPREE